MALSQLPLPKTNLAVNYHCNNGAALLVVLAKFAALVAEACAKEAEAAIDPEWPNDDQSVQAQNIAAAIQEGATASLPRPDRTSGVVGIVIAAALYSFLGTHVAVGFVGEHVVDAEDFDDEADDL